MRIYFQNTVSPLAELQGGNDEVHGTIVKILEEKFGPAPVVLSKESLDILEGMDCAYRVLKFPDTPNSVTPITVLRRQVEKNGRIIVELRSRYDKT